MIKRSTPTRLILLIIGGLFVSEMISMGIIVIIDAPSYLQTAIIDSLILTLFATPLLFYLSLRPLLKVISEREAEIARRQQTENQLRVQTTALETAANGVVITDNEGRVIWANKAFTRISGYFIGEILGKKMSFLRSGVHTQAFYQNLWETILSGHVWRGEIVNRRKDGNYYVGEITISPVLNSSREVENFIAIQQDITERKQAESDLRKSEEKFRNLLDWTYDWEIWIDAQNNVMYSSPSCERVTGYQPDDFIANPELLASIVHADDREIFEEHIKHAHDEAVGAINVEYRIIACNGSEHWISHNCRPLFGGDSRYLGRRVSNRDVTEQKQIETEIRERNQREKNLTETIHTMQINIARDLHDTIGQNISYLRLKLDQLSGTPQESTASIHPEIKSMAKVANESYDLVRGTLAVLQSENTVDLFRFFTRYANQVEERSKIKIDFGSDGEAKVLSANQMRQLFYIFREALANVEKHSGATQVFVKLIWAEDGFNLIVLDNGQGMEPANLRNDGHYGLKFMRERAELLNGLIAIDSEVGAGTNITISVPYVEVERNS
ncbi:MAG: PAS domain S-box protein [Chloroflexi bacterium]|nr:PAS domain S-box protein [Chloroflexota bacterium]